MRRSEKGLPNWPRSDLLSICPAATHQLGEVTDLARTFPHTTIILNHVGGIVGIGDYAGRRDEIFAAWKQSLSEVAACPNVLVKLGGLCMDYCGFNWQGNPLPPTSAELAEAQRPYFDAAIEMFGPDRCMFESNFPRRQDQLQLRRIMEFLQAHNPRVFASGKGEAVS